MMASIPDDEVVLSPCVSICAMDSRTGYCMGCYRTLEEIECWTLYTNEEKRAIRAQIGPRRRSS
jgi:uncharacterized protein